jgi:hypothetical protein
MLKYHIAWKANALGFHQSDRFPFHFVALDNA